MGQSLPEKAFAIGPFTKDRSQRAIRATYLDYFSDELVTPRERLVIQNRRNIAVTYLVSLNPPFLALQRGERMASVMTTSSGPRFSKATEPIPVLEAPV